jgi:hypothetical protein
MVSYDHVEDALIRRLARQIRVYPSAGGSFPYRACLTLSFRGDPMNAPPGHPYCLVAAAATPEAAVSDLLLMIELWLSDPFDPDLEIRAHDGLRRAPRRRLEPSLGGGSR